LSGWWMILLLTRDRRLNALVVCTHDACRVAGKLSIVRDRKKPDYAYHVGSHMVLTYRAWYLHFPWRAPQYQ
jgi:hypothetical protein